MNRRKKPDGLIEGCFGPTQYCSRCKLEKYLGDTHYDLCKDCIPIVIAEQEKKKKDFKDNFWNMIDEKIKSREGEMNRLLCKKCGWYMDDVAVKPFCPDCKKERLWHMKGTKEEIEQRTEELKAEREK